MPAFASCLILSGGLFAASASPAPAAIERVVEKTFTVAGAGTLRIETQGGGIRVQPGAASAVRVVARQKIRAATEAEADELLKKLELTFEQSGNDVSAVARYEKRSGWGFGSWPPVTVEFEVTVPAEFATRLQTSGGGIVVGDLRGACDARTSGGAIKLGTMGGAVVAKTSGGGITLAGGAATATLHTSGGSITAGRVAGAADLSTSGGGIVIEAVGGKLRAHTSGGSIRAGITGALSDDCSLSTSGGSVKVNVSRTAAFQLDAATSGGGVDASGLAITLEKSGRDRSRLAGAVNGGGPVLKLRSSGGGIGVRVE
ncbi:MAG: DUF4097 family beta strand repeat-containing protein [Opitutaceae bacterium]|nr:DUF4097 family beta strand repeat-containing protein [Opitutaceae bacterium]